MCTVLCSGWVVRRVTPAVQWCCRSLQAALFLLHWLQTSAGSQLLRGEAGDFPHFAPTFRLPLCDQVQYITMQSLPPSHARSSLLSAVLLLVALPAVPLPLPLPPHCSLEVCVASGGEEGGPGLSPLSRKQEKGWFCPTQCGTCSIAGVAALT